MLKFYKDENQITKEIPRFEKDCWVRVVAPTNEELQFLKTELHVSERSLITSLDTLEVARVENKGGLLQIIADAPFVEKSNGYSHFATYPISIFMQEECVITISSKPYTFFDEVFVDSIDTFRKENFVFILLSKIAKDYNTKLKEIEEVKVKVENRLRTSVRNRELFDIMDIQKSLVYFTMALKKLEKIMQQINQFHLELSNQDQQLLEHVLVEFQQAQESAEIYKKLLDNAVVSWTSIISNNLNSVIKNLTIITIIIAIPTLVYSFYGMNVLQLPFIQNPWFATIFSIFITALVTWLLFQTKKRK
jgi:magnesium transporter